MKKQILNLGKALDRSEQKRVLGGGLRPTKFRCIVTAGDPRCCTPSECGETGGIWCPTCTGYGTSSNCACF